MLIVRSARSGGDFRMSCDRVVLLALVAVEIVSGREGDAHEIAKRAPRLQQGGIAARDGLEILSSPVRYSQDMVRWRTGFENTALVRN